MRAARKGSEHDPGHPIDMHVGAKIRLRRKALGITQDALAQMLGLTFQQVQKYERAGNRTSASRLYDLSRALRVPVSYFFEGYDEPDAEGEFTELRPERAVRRFLLTTEGVELAEVFPRVKSARLRRKVTDLVTALAGDGTDHGRRGRH